MSTEKKSWFIREVSLGNLLIAAPLIGGLFVAYGKWTGLEATVEEHGKALGMLATNVESFKQSYNSQQADLRVQIEGISTKLDERTGKVK